MTDANAPGVKMYTTTWCGICVHTKRYLKTKKVDVEEIDIEQHPEFGDMIERLTGGYRIVPTLDIAGKVMVNPSRREIDEALAGASDQLPARKSRQPAARSRAAAEAGASLDQPARRTKPRAKAAKPNS